jgi:hypothetical protein
MLNATDARPVEAAPPRPKRLDPDGFSHTMAAYRIAAMGEVEKYIANIDFSMQKRNMRSREDGLNWSREKCEHVEVVYKRWLLLRRKYEAEDMPPSIEIDKFWHEHMLDTRAYFEHTARIFGYYHHHFPYFGMRNGADEVALHEAWKNTSRRYRENFGEELRPYEGG